MVFEKTYSNQYDRFYLDKDYASECDLVAAVFDKFESKPRTLLDLGCGTGSHALLLAERGYRVTGVDRSPHMLETAREKAGEKNLEINFIQHDISTLTPGHPDLDTPVDAVISMFAVIGYLTGNAQLAETFANIRRFLKPGGVFLFDCWYGPAVVSQRPEPRVHTYDIADGHRVLRLVTPEPDSLNHAVDINYRVLEIKGNSVLNETSETHRMRYFFPMEIRYFLETAGFSDIRLFPFDDMERQLTPGDWNMLVTAK